jgi:PAS domain S-box-containing protein
MESVVTGSRSLMDFVEAPLLVGDPDGRVVYVNPSFEQEFGRSRGQVSGQPLAIVFEGGGREAILDAVARVCGGEAGVRFHLREAGRGFAALASPVEVEEGRVGVIVLLMAEAGDERLLAFQRAVREPLDELAGCLQAISGAADELPQKLQILVAEGMRALERIRKWSESVQAAAR